MARSSESGSPGIPDFMTLMLLTLVFLAGIRSMSHAATWGEAYAGAFVGAARTDNRIVDPTGFANWGRLGWATDYDDGDFAWGFLAGRKFTLGKARFRLELDGARGNVSAHSDRVDPVGRDETARASIRWAATARLGNL